VTEVRSAAEIVVRIEAVIGVVVPAVEAVAGDVDAVVPDGAAVVVSVAVDTAEAVTKLQSMKAGRPARSSGARARQSLRGRDRGLFLSNTHVGPSAPAA
jgi:hypothetical protein